MKNFIKNSIITLFHSKWILGLLLIFSLAAAALFTSYANSNKSYSNDYNMVMKQGEVPDVAAYEEYNYKFGLEMKGTIKNQYEFGFVDGQTSKYVINSTQRNTSHYMVNPPSTAILFQPFNPSFTWLVDINDVPNVANYIQEKHNLLLAELKSDDDSRIKGVVTSEFPSAKIQQFESLTIKTDGNEVIETAKINQNTEVNKIVYTSGENNLFDDTDNEFNEFQSFFDKTKVAINNNIIESSKYKPYLPLYYGINVNFPMNDKSSPEAKAFSDLIAYCDNSSVSQPDWNILKSFFNKVYTVNSQESFTIGWTDLLPKMIVLSNPSSFKSVISTANVFHGNYRYSPKAYEAWTDFLKNCPKGAKYNRESLIQEIEIIKKAYPESCLSIKNNSFLIVGEGITPNYIFPLLLGSTSIDVNNQKILFVSESGYKLIRAGYATAPETIVTFVKFPGFSHNQIQKAINEINNWAKENMNLQSYKSAYFMDDSSGLNELAGMRMQFLPELNKRINNIYMIVTAAMWILTLVLIFFIIKIIVNKNRSVISLFNANGFHMIKLVASFSLLVTIPIIMGYLIGTIFGFFGQEIIDNFLNNYWVTTQAKLIFDWKLFLISFTLFSAAVIIGSLIVGIGITRRNLTTSLKKDDTYGNSYFALAVKKFFFFTTIVTRMRISIIFNSLWKMVILVILMAVYASIFSFFLATFGKFSQARFYTDGESNYGYSISLVTPTIQSGPLHYIDDFSLGRTEPGFVNSSNSLFSLSNWKNLEFVSAKTLISYENDILFLNDAVGAKITLDYNFGNNQYVGANIWNIASGIIPTSQLISSNSDYSKLIEYLYSSNDNYDTNGKLGKFIVKLPDNRYTFTDECFSQVADFKIGISEQFATFLRNAFFNKQNELSKRDIYSYYLNYGIIGLNKQVIGDRVFFDGQKYEAPQYGYLRMESTDEGLCIYGIQNNDPWDADYLGPKLILENGEVINNQISKPTQTDPQHPIYNVIVNNAFAATKNLHVGSIFGMKFTNYADRIFSPELTPEKNPSVAFKVINISRAAKTPRAYINFEDANRILHFTKDTAETSCYFNGFYTSPSDNLNFIKHSVSLFSASGLYPGCSTFDEGGFWNMLKTTIDSNGTPQKKQLAIALNINETALNSESINDYVNILLNKYTYPYFSVVTNLDSTYAEMQIFDTTANTVNHIMIFALLTLVLMASIMLVIISFLTIDNLRKFGIRLQVLGYNKVEVLTSLLSICFPTFILGVLLAQPLLLLVMKIFSSYIFKLTQIVLVMKMSFVISLVGALAVLLMIVIAFLLSYYFLSKTNNLINDTKNF